MADLTDLTAVLKDINKKYGSGSIQIGCEKEEDPLKKFSFGTPGIDFCTYNSVPNRGIFIELSGAEGSGKTLLSFLIAADFIKKEKEKPKEERRQILFVDAEGTLDADWAMVSAHYDVNDPDVPTLYYMPTGQSAEQIFDIVRECVQTGKIGLVIFDSLTAIAPQVTNEESFEKKDMGGIAKPLADFVKRCTGLFLKYRTPFIGIMGLITNISGYGVTETTPGGTYWRRACSLRIRIKKGAYIDEDGNELKSTAENPAGYILETRLQKTKFCRPDRIVGRCHVNFRTGVDVLMDTIEVAINLGLIDNKTQGYYKLIDPDTGEVLTDREGKPVVIHGKKDLKPYFKSHGDLWKRMHDAVYEKISITDDDTIKSYEELLNIDTSLDRVNMDILETPAAPAEGATVNSNADEEPELNKIL